MNDTNTDLPDISVLLGVACKNKMFYYDAYRSTRWISKGLIRSCCCAGNGCLCPCTHYSLCHRLKLFPEFQLMEGAGKSKEVTETYSITFNI